MHGLICKAAELFIRSQHGEAAWRRIRAAAGLEALLGEGGFDTMRLYEPEVMDRLLAAVHDELGLRPFATLEDMGTWLCTHPPMEPVRRLFRFSGASFREMLFALDEIHDRARMALPDLDLPQLSLIELGGGRYRVASSWTVPGAGAVIIGILRAMADDYGTLAWLEHEHGAEVNGTWTEILAVRMLDDRFHAPRPFELGGAA